ncbi:histidine kinase [Streptomyces sp. NPDC059166]|uniref:histidine kinase n=1 Tax=Streptomyces sp. NPDC059166 TaxID=3346752 RepID=UPI003677A41F
MPSFDISRARFRLADEHLIVLSELATGAPLPGELATARQELVDCGLVDGGGRLSPLLLPLINTVLSPGVVVSLEAAGRQGSLHHGMLIGEEHVVAHEAWPGTNEAEYSLVDPKMLVWKLADMVNLRQTTTGVAPGASAASARPASDASGAALSVVETAVGTAEAGLAVLAGPAVLPAAEERRAILEALAAGGPARPAERELDLLAELISGLRSSWRLTSAWRGHGDGRDVTTARGIAVWDCGPLGYWQRELPTEPVAEERITPDAPFRLVRVEPRTLWAQITGLLPDAAELRLPATGAGAA